MPEPRNGDTFPALTVDAAGGGYVPLPGDLAGSPRRRADLPRIIVPS